MKKIVAIISILLITLASNSWSADPPRFSDEQLIPFFQSLLSTSVAAWPAGEMRVVNQFSTPNWEQDRTIDATTYRWILAAEKVGLVTVVEDKEYGRFLKGEGQFSFDLMDEAMKLGVTKKIAVTLTKDGERLPISKTPSMLGWRYTPQAAYSSIEVIGQEIRWDGTHYYALLSAKYKADYSRITQAQWQMQNNKWGADNRKVAVLWKLELDPSKKKGWNYTGVYALADEGEKLDIDALYGLRHKAR